MTPDEQHTEYFKNNPNGNHTSPSPETLRLISEIRDTQKEHTTAYTEHLKEHEMYHREMRDFMTTIDKKIDINTVKTEEGMSAINKRLDIANGRTAKIEQRAEKNEKDILLILDRQANRINRDKTIGEFLIDILKFIVTGVIGAAVTIFTVLRHTI